MKLYIFMKGLKRDVKFLNFLSMWSFIKEITKSVNLKQSL